MIKPKALPGFSTLVTLAHTEYKAPQAEGVARPFDDRTVPASASYAQMPQFAPRVTSSVVDTTWALSEQPTLENRFVAGDFAIRRNAVAGDGIATIDGHDYTLEPRLRYNAPDKSWSGFVGLYGFHASQHPTRWTCSAVAPGTIAPAPAPCTAKRHSR